MEKIMILGAGPAQLPLFRAAKTMGYATVAATIPGNYPGIPVADEVSYTDITDPDGIARAAAELGVCAVASCCSEICLPAQAHACEVLGLPGLSPAAAEISVNKLAMKRVFAEHGVRSADFRVLYSPDDLDAAIEALGLPVVIKAADLQGSIGVYVVSSPEEARSAMAQCLTLTKKDCCLAEEFLPGDNLGAEAFVQNGEVIFVLPDGTISHRGRTNIPIGHFAPLDVPAAVHDSICAEAEKAIRACGFDNCAVNLDLILRDGVPYIVELTARAGATCLPEIVSLHYGVDYYRMILMAALGQDVRPLFRARPAEASAVAARMLAAPQTGILRSVRMPASPSDAVYDLHLIVAEGSRVNQFRETGDRIGQIIVTGPSVPACLSLIDDTLSAMTLEVEPC